jgi:F-type H+-transporting ATPase subunit b
VKKSLLKGLFPALLLGALLFAPVCGIERVAKAQAASENQTSQERQTLHKAKVEEEVDETAEYKHSAMVKKIGGMLGMDTEQAAVVFEWANFLILAGLVGWGMLKILPKTFRDRGAAIQKELAQARVATEEASARLGGVEERLAKLDGQIAAMRTQAEQDAARDEERIKASVEAEKKNIVAAAEQEIATATAQAQKALQQYAAELAIEQAARKLVVSAETDRLLVQSFAQRLTSSDSKKGQN